MRVLQPPGWARPRGYSNGIAARGTLVVTAGMIGWNAEQVFESVDFVHQVRQALANVAATLAEAGARPEHVVRLTWFVTDRDEYLARQQEIGVAYREVMGRHYPAMSVVQVTALMEASAKVEIEATAVLPDEPRMR